MQAGVDQARAAAAQGIRVTESVPVKSNDVDFATPAASSPAILTRSSCGPWSPATRRSSPRCASGFDGVFFGGVNLSGGALDPAAADARVTYLANGLIACEQLPWANGAAFTKDYTTATGSVPDSFSAGDPIVFEGDNALT